MSVPQNGFDETAVKPVFSACMTQVHCCGSSCPKTVAKSMTMVALVALADLDHGGAGGGQLAAAPAGPDTGGHRPPVVVGGRATSAPSRAGSFTTANEIHIPVGEPVRV